MWAQPDLPRIIATLALEKARDRLAAAAAGGRLRHRARGEDVRHQPVLVPSDGQHYTAPLDWRGAFARVKGRIIVVIADADDQLMDAERLSAQPAAARVPLTILPGVDHMESSTRPEAIKAILAAMAEGDLHDVGGLMTKLSRVVARFALAEVRAADRLLAPSP